MPFDAISVEQPRNAVTECIRRDFNRVALLEDALAEHDNELAEMQERMLKRATKRFVESGKPQEEAEYLAYRALHEPSKYKIPTIDELGG